MLRDVSRCDAIVSRTVTGRTHRDLIKSGAACEFPTPTIKRGSVGVAVTFNLCGITRRLEALILNLAAIVTSLLERDHCAEITIFKLR